MKLMYGTAWKEDATEACVIAALDAGFRAIDTANQRKHYYEQGVGRAIARSGVPRDQLFIQTKFTFRDGQDHRLPYHEHAPVRDQVVQSHAKSLEHLGVAKIDSYLLHGPSRTHGLGPADREAWAAMEQLPVGAIGVSNVSAAQLKDLLSIAHKKPAFVQNRCYASTGWDRDVRALCYAENITYQGFSLLTANRSVVARLAPLAGKYNVQPPQVVFRFAQQVGMLPLTGTKDPRHMKQDLAADDFTLTPDEIATIEKLA